MRSLLQHGDMICTPARRIPLALHYGIFDARHRRVIHNTLPGGVQTASLREFANGKVKVEKRAMPGTGDFVVARAYALIGLDYDLINLMRALRELRRGRSEGEPSGATCCSWPGPVGGAAALIVPTFAVTAIQVPWM